MCAIAGFNFSVNSKFILDKLYHRGPDEQSEWSDKFITLFHTRLAIQDISNGHQPFFYKNYVIIFNGEIYNHLELRSLLKEFNFKTSSDTETLLYLFIKYKENMFEMIDGIFAFAIYDRNKKTIFLVRDRAGKKPFFIIKKITILDLQVN
jgi:asparagine synthase (glutamine-hydrolysing)